MLNALLAQSDPDLSRLLLPAIGILVLSALAFVIVVQVKKRMNAADNDAEVAPGGFTLSDLRRLHKAGKISDKEFEKTRQGVILAAQRAATREAAAKAQPAGKTAGKMVPGFDVVDLKQESTDD